ncbi:MAG: L,D-transpeptidase family protein [Gammaproteobacteria bacterium]|nr:L,D-transpeptidase family protein [Gammaproteobacteria bacterium]
MALLLLGGCGSLGKAGRIALEDRPVEEPLPPNEFVLVSDKQTVIGQPQVVFASDEDTLSDLAREYGLGYDEIVAANPGIDPWLPGHGTPVLLPTQYVLPGPRREGVVLNIATRRLFYFPRAVDGEQRRVLTYPVGIGRVGWETPVGETTVVSKARDPHWWVPSSVRIEHAEMGDPLPAVVPPGPDNPLGHRVLKLGMPGYLIHGTNKPYGVGMRVSHGCVRLYPENIEFLYDLVDVGEPVTIINEPYQMGRHDGVLFFEAHQPLEEDETPAEARLRTLFDDHFETVGKPLNVHVQGHVRTLADTPLGVPLRVARYDADEYLARVRVVRNTVEHDPDAPTLTEVRELLNAAEDEAESL